MIKTAIIAALAIGLIATIIAGNYQRNILVDVVADRELYKAMYKQEYNVSRRLNSLVLSQLDTLQRQNELLDWGVREIEKRDAKIAELKEIIRMQADGSFRLFIEPIKEETQ
jgi:hypothetical protein